MPQVFDMVNAKAISVYWQELVSNRVPYLGETLFPAKKKAGLDLAFIKGAKGLPVALKPSNFDAQPTLRDRIGVTKLETEMPFFREAMKIKEKDRQDLMRFRDNEPGLYEPIMGEIMDDRSQLIEGALIQSERMRMGLLAYGKFTISDNNVLHEYDYDVDGTWKTNNTITLSGTSAWSDVENSNPIEDIMDMQDSIEAETGTRPTRAIMTRKTFSYLTRNKAIRLDMDAETKIVTDSMIQQYVSVKLGINIAVYNKMFKDEKKATQQFYPDNHVTLLPPHNLGNTWYGTTPEEADLMSGVDNIDVQIVETGVAVTVQTTYSPVNRNTIVSEIVLPSFERMDEIGVLKVA